MTDPTKPSDTASPALHIDSDWKAQAQAERERLAKQESERASRDPKTDADGLPPAEFRSLVGLLASQAIMGLGTMGDQQGRVIVDLPGANFAINLLEVLQDKTKGNLTPEEQAELDDVVRELKMRFVQVARLVTEQAARGQAVPAGGTAGAPAAIASPGQTGGAQGGAAASKLIVP